jgi:sirohydrochlorin cobaltochelatase
VSEDFSDAALVLVGHGSTVNADSAAPTWLHADELRRRGLFAQVRETFWKQEPYLWQALRGIFAPRVFVVPLFISEGYFTQEVIPRGRNELCPRATTRRPDVPLLRPRRHAPQHDGGFIGPRPRHR